MRLYFFVNLHIGGIHAGIQSGHAAMKLARKYRNDEAAQNVVDEFIDNHETFVLLNGGESDSMNEILTHLQREDCPLLWQEFRDSGIDNAMTAIAVLVPEHLYARPEKPIDMWEVEFLKLKAVRPLAS